jgi:magnesium chelatase family protein
VVARANAHVVYPARVQLVAAMNPCRCGHMADVERACSRAPRCGADYQGKISGPLLDRIDIQIDVPAVSAMDLGLPTPRETSSDVAARVARARDRQVKRYAEFTKGKLIRTNAEADGTILEEVAAPDAQGRDLLGRACDKFKLSARGYHRILKLARTLADLEGSDNVRYHHIAEALAYRRASMG